MIGVRRLTLGRGRSGWRHAASSGALLCIRLAFVYAFAFIVYAFIRSALTVGATVNPDAGMIPTLAATWASLFVAALMIALLLVPLVAVMGTLMGVLIKAVSLILETRHAMPRAFIVGTIVSLALVVLLRLGLRSVINFSLSDLISETALFWLELPSLIFLVASGWASRQLAFSRM